VQDLPRVTGIQMGAQMPMREVLQEIAAGWSSYRRKGRVDKTDLVHSLVARQFPQTIRPYLPKYEYLKFKGSTGAGNITAAPWIAVFDPRITTSATTGYYVVYLFSADAKTVTLCLAFGTTQFEKQFGGPAKSFPRMREAASRLQDLFRQIVPATLSREPIRLGVTRREKLHYAYEQSSIFSYEPYVLDDLPTEERLVSDLQEIVDIYTKIVSDPLTPELDLVVQTAIASPKTLARIEVREFAVRAPRQKKTPRGVPPARGGGTRRNPARSEMQENEQSFAMNETSLSLWDVRIWSVRFDGIRKSVNIRAGTSRRSTKTGEKFVSR
jgi:hypothetical protein